MRKLIYVVGMVAILAAAFVVVQKANPHPTETDKAISPPKEIPSLSAVENLSTSSVASWPRFVSSIISIPYPPNWYFDEPYHEDAANSILIVDFWNRRGARRGSDGGRIQISLKDPTENLNQRAERDRQADDGYTVSDSISVVVNGFSAVRYDFNYYDFEYGSNIVVECGRYIIAVRMRFIPPEEPTLSSSTLWFHKAFASMRLSRCEAG